MWINIDSTESKDLWYNIKENSNDINDFLISVWNKTFNILDIQEKISDFLSLHESQLFLNNDEKYNPEEKKLEINTKIFLSLAKHLWVNLNDLLADISIRKFIKVQLWFKASDRFYIKNNRIFIIEYIEKEKRFNWFNERDLELLIEELDLLKLEKKEFISSIIDKKIDLFSMNDDEIIAFLTNDFRKYIKNIIIDTVNKELEDKIISEWISGMIYRKYYKEINALVINKIQNYIKDEDLLLVSSKLKDTILNYFEIWDELLWVVANKVLLKFKSSFNRVFLSWIIPNSNEVEKFHEWLEKRLKKVFVNELLSIFDSYIWVKLNKNLQDILVKEIYFDKRDSIKFWLAKTIVDMIMYNWNANTVSYKIYNFFSYYSWDWNFYKYPEFKLPSLKIKKELHNRELYNEMVKKLSYIYKIENDLLKISELHKKNIEQYNFLNWKIKNIENEISEIEDKVKEFRKKIQYYENQIKILEKDFFSRKELKSMKEKLKNEDLYYKESSYKRKISDKKNDLLTHKARLRNLSSYEDKLKFLEKESNNNKNIYLKIILDVSKLIFELKKQV